MPKRITIYLTDETAQLLDGFPSASARIADVLTMFRQVVIQFRPRSLDQADWLALYRHAVDFPLQLDRRSLAILPVEIVGNSRFSGGSGFDAQALADKLAALNFAEMAAVIDCINAAHRGVAAHRFASPESAVAAILALGEGESDELFRGTPLPKRGRGSSPSQKSLARKVGKAAPRKR